MKLTIENLEKSYGRTKALAGFSYEFTPGIYGILGANGAGKSTLFGLLTDTLRRQSGQILWDVADRKLGQFSGGMRQRALLAQAMLGDPELLILDEPTAGVDPRERIRIRGFIAGLARERIVLLATHVVTDVECIADRVLLMNKGRLLKADRPENLIASIQTKAAEKLCTPEEIERYQQQYGFGSLFQRQEGQVLRLIGDELPAEFAPVESGLSLEEVYLYYCT